MGDERDRVCPVELAGGLDNRIRRWLQNPGRILGPYVNEGMTVLDLGCGPGHFTIAMAQMAGASGHVIAADLQEGMLQKIREKIGGTGLEKRITLHQCRPDRIGVSEPVDFALAFFMVHEVPDKVSLFREVGSLLKPEGRLLVVEPPFHVSKQAFAETIRLAHSAGLAPAERPRIPFCKAVILRGA